MKSKILSHLKEINPEILNLENIGEITKIEKIGLGESNLNYLAVINGKKFNFRVNMDLNSSKKLVDEYDGLKLVQNLGIAPRAFHYESSRHVLGGSFLILEYFDGISLNKIETNAVLISKLAKMAAEIHSMPIEKSLHEKLRKSDTSEIISLIDQRINYITRKISCYPNNLDLTYILLETNQKIKQMAAEIPPPQCYVLGHGDIAPQNSILHRDELKLIDWEDLGLIDPALELAIIFDSFDFIKDQKAFFLTEYLKYRDDHELRNRVNMVQPIQLFSTFCWAIVHVFRIRDKEMQEDFIKEQNLLEHIDYAQKMFEKCKKCGILDKNLQWFDHYFPWCT